MDSEKVLLNTIHDLFSFVSSLGHDGFVGSSYYKIPSTIKRAENEVNYGFSFFTIVLGLKHKLNRDTFSTHKLRLINNVSQFCNKLWSSIKSDLADFDEYFIDFNDINTNVFGAKMDFLKTIFHAKIYLSNLEYSDIDSPFSFADSLDNPSNDRDIEEFKKHSQDEEHDIESITKTISVNIIKRLEDLLYTRTRMKTDLVPNDKLIENIFDFIPTFLNNVIGCQLLMHSDENLNKEIVNFAKYLRIFLEYSDDKYYSQVVLIYEQLTKVLDDRLEIIALFKANNSLIIKKMLLKITQPECSEDHYLSTIKFMIAYSSIIEGAVHLFEERATDALISTYLLKDLDNEDYYRTTQRNSKHILWLWTLHLMRQLTAMLSSESDFTYSALKFITAFEQRILKVLQFKGYRDSNNNYRTITIARIEEIEHIINLISYVLINIDQWKSNKNEQLTMIINILFSYTIGLFRSNISLSDSFIPMSTYENYINSLSENFKNDNTGANSEVLMHHKISTGSDGAVSQSVKSAIQGKIVTSIRTPMKGEYSGADFNLLEHDEYSRRPYKASTLDRISIKDYSPNGFLLKVELTLSKISLMLLRSMHLILKDEIKHVRDSDFLKELTYFHERTNESKMYILCQSIFDCVQFSQNCCKKWMTKFKSTSNLNKVLNGASMATHSLLDSQLDIVDALDITTGSSDLGLLICMKLLQAAYIVSEDDYSKNYIERSDKRTIDNIKKYSEESKLLTLEKESLLENNQKVNRNVVDIKNDPKSLKINVKEKVTNADVILSNLR